MLINFIYDLEKQRFPIEVKISIFHYFLSNKDAFEGIVDKYFKFLEDGKK